MKKVFVYTACCYFLCTVNTLIASTCYLFIGSYNFNRNKEGIFVYRFDTETGALQKISATRDIPNPSYITISPDGKYIYACTETQTKKSRQRQQFPVR